MTVREVAELLGYEYDTLRKKVKELYPDIVENGKTTYLTEQQVFYLKQYLTPRTLALKSEVDNAVTDIEMKQKAAEVMAWLLRDNEQLKQRNAELEPKAEFYDAVTGSDDTIDIGSAAKVLAIPGLGRNNLFAKLRDAGVLMPNNQPYQKHIDAGYFRTIESSYTKPDGSTHINIKTVVYQRGLNFIRKMVTEK